MERTPQNSPLKQIVGRGNKQVGMTFDDFFKQNRSKLLGYHLLSEWFSGGLHIETPYPPSDLSEEKLQELKIRFNECVPLNSCIVDLWDWDVHFEDYLTDDWYFEAVFGSADTLQTCASELEEFFLEQVNSLDLDYNQHEDQESFRDYVREEAQQFIKNWRDNIYKRFAPTAAGRDGISRP